MARARKMNIAILIPSHVPFATGGLEKHADELAKYGMLFSEHKFEKIVIPTPELSVTEVIGSYKLWHGINLDHFDCIVSLKYPTWVCSHQNHVLWMTSKLRGLYDLADPSFESSIDKEDKNVIDKFISNLPIFPKESYLTEICDRMIEFAGEHRDEPAFRFPGYYIQKAVEYLDFVSLSPIRISRFFTNSNNVKNRKGYFFWRSQVEALYPPLFEDDKDVMRFGQQKLSYESYILSVGRLSPEKRVDLTINAFKKSNVGDKLIICGDGPQRNYLEEISHGDKRISILGFVSEKEKDNLYRNAKAVIFTPKDEDYGYITGEAFKYKKPVITTDDSGGVLELIENGVSGLVTGNKVSEIAESIEAICRGDISKKMGEAGFKRIEKLTWKNTIEKIFPKKLIKGKMGLKKKLYVLSTYRILPAVNGGQIRAWNLYKNLADEFEIHLVCVSDQINLGFGRVYEEKVSDSIYQTIIVIDEEFKNLFWKLQAKYSNTPLFDIACLKFGSYLKSFLNYVETNKENIDLLVFCQPYLYSEKLISVLNKKTRLLFEEQNLEWQLKKDFFGDKEIWEMVKETEMKLVELSELINCASADIINGFPKKYQKRCLYLPNGFDFGKFKFVTEEDRLLLREKLNVENNIVVFVGSLHKPNIGAVDIIFKLAKVFLDEKVTFVVAGSICRYFTESDITIPENVFLAGSVTDEMLYAYLSLSDVALNPMFTGGGSNVKMMTYAAAGVPVITSKVGNRDFNLVNGRDCLVANSVEDFRNGLRKVFKSSALRQKLRENIYKEAKGKYDWKLISDMLKNKLMKI